VAVFWFWFLDDSVFALYSSVMLSIAVGAGTVVVANKSRSAQALKCFAVLHGAVVQSVFQLGFLVKLSVFSFVVW
jgi:hypothetical protein